MAIDWATELPLIKRYALSYQVDWKLIAAIRFCEAGGPGREYGVLSVSAPTYLDQLKVACQSVRNHLAADRVGFLYINKTLPEWHSHSALHINPSWIQSFANRWAPPNAANDPKHLNDSWYKNFMNEYFRRWLEEAAPLVEPVQDDAA